MARPPLGRRKKPTRLPIKIEPSDCLGRPLGSVLRNFHQTRAHRIIARAPICLLVGLAPRFLSRPIHFRSASRERAPADISISLGPRARAAGRRPPVLSLGRCVCAISLRNTFTSAGASIWAPICNLCRFSRVPTGAPTFESPALGAAGRGLSSRGTWGGGPAGGGRPPAPLVGRKVGRPT